MGGSSGAASNPGPPVYQPQNQGAADYNVSRATTDLANNPNLQNIFNQMYGAYQPVLGVRTSFNPEDIVQAGYNVQGASMGDPAAAMAILNQGFDPQGKVFNQVQQQVRDQTNAQLAQSGLANSPFAAGIMGTNQSNTDIAWQNNLLNREAQAASAATGLQKQYGEAQTQGAALQGLGPQLQMGLAEGLQGLQMNALWEQQQAIQDWLAYMHQGTEASAVGIQEAQMQNQAAASNAAQGMQGIGQGLSLMGGLMGK